MPGFGHSGRPSEPLVVVLGIAILSIVAWVTVARITAKYSDRYESFYPSLAEADKDGAITRGWVPDELLPRSSRSIHERHDLSHSTEWCAFEFLSTDSQHLLGNLTQVDVPPQRVRHVPSPDVSWWPSVLVGNLDVQRIKKAGFDLYALERPSTSVTTAVYLFAIDWSRGRGFFFVAS